MGTLLECFRDDCRAYYVRPRERHNMAARVPVYKKLLARHDATVVLRHVAAISGVLSRAELEFACGEAAETLRRAA